MGGCRQAGIFRFEFGSVVVGAVTEDYDAGECV